MIRFNRRPIGSYMSRWILTLPFGFNVRLHHIREADADPELHDHPFWFVSLVLRGWYVEEQPATGGDWTNRETGRHHATPLPGGSRAFTTRRAGSIAYRPASVMHRICIISPGGVWTLVFARRVNGDEWGFWTRTGWVHWKQFHSAKQGAIVNHGGEA